MDGGNIGLIEVYNAHPRSNQAGHAGFRPAVEDLWDQLLTGGNLVYGVAADDAHDFKWYRQILRRFGTAPPGGAWIMIRAPVLTAENVVRALASGDFYASTGVHLKQVSSTGGYYEVELDMERTLDETRHSWVRAAAPVAGSDDSHFVIEFIGSHGRVLHSAHDQAKAGIHMEESHGYIRARVTYLEKLARPFGSNRARSYFAWTQPVMTTQDQPNP